MGVWGFKDIYIERDGRTKDPLRLRSADTSPGGPGEAMKYCEKYIGYDCVWEHGAQVYLIVILA